MIKIILLIIAAMIVLAILAFGLYFCCSPMPIVRLLRRGEDAPPGLPADYADHASKVEFQKDLAYAGGHDDKFDLYMPRTADKNYSDDSDTKSCAGSMAGKATGMSGITRLPVILWVHGGAFVAGDKCGLENWATMLASEGYAVAAMNYTWAPEAAYPTQLRQVCQCVEKLMAMAAQNVPLDMEHLIIAGDSAGAHMAAQFALIHTNPEMSAALGIPSPLPAHALRAALLYCGPYDIKLMMHPKSRMLRLFISRIGWSYFGKKRWEKLPLAETVNIPDFVTADFPPAYITDGNHVSFESQGRRLAQTLRSMGVPVKDRFFEAEDGVVNHEYQADLSSENGMKCYKDTVAFLSEYH